MFFLSLLFILYCRFTEYIGSIVVRFVSAQVCLYGRTLAILLNCNELIVAVSGDNCWCDCVWRARLCVCCVRSVKLYTHSVLEYSRGFNSICLNGNAKRERESTVSVFMPLSSPYSLSGCDSNKRESRMSMLTTTTTTESRLLYIVNRSCLLFPHNFSSYVPSAWTVYVVVAMFSLSPSRFYFQIAAAFIIVVCCFFFFSRFIQAEQHLCEHSNTLF